MNTNFYNKIKEIIDKDSRYSPDAYEFVMQALWHTQQKIKNNGHVSGKELLEGIKEFALEQYGPMARTVINYWGIYQTGHFGDIVFNMIEKGLMGKTEADLKEDFNDVYDFQEAFNAFKGLKLRRRKNPAKNSVGLKNEN